MSTAAGSNVRKTVMYSAAYKAARHAPISIRTYQHVICIYKELKMLTHHGTDTGDVHACMHVCNYIYIYIYMYVHICAYTYVRYHLLAGAYARNPMISSGGHEQQGLQAQVLYKKSLKHSLGQPSRRKIRKATVSAGHGFLAPQRNTLSG